MPVCARAAELARSSTSCLSRSGKRSECALKQYWREARGNNRVEAARRLASKDIQRQRRTLLPDTFGNEHDATQSTQRALQRVMRHRRGGRAWRVAGAERPQPTAELRRTPERWVASAAHSGRRQASAISDDTAPGSMATLSRRQHVQQQHAAVSCGGAARQLRTSRRVSTGDTAPKGSAAHKAPLQIDCDKDGRGACTRRPSSACTACPRRLPDVDRPRSP